MKITGKLLLVGAGILPLLTIVAGGVVRADELTKNDGFMAKIAERFTLDKDEVHAFIKEEREIKKAETQAKVTDALKEAGFSDQQISTLQAKRVKQAESRRQWLEENTEATKEERRAHRQSEREEFESWAEDQAIDLEKMREALKNVMPLGHDQRFKHRH